MRRNFDENIKHAEEVLKKARTLQILNWTIPIAFIVGVSLAFVTVVMNSFREYEFVQAVQAALDYHLGNFAYRSKFFVVGGMLLTLYCLIMEPLRSRLNKELTEGD